MRLTNIPEIVSVSIRKPNIMKKKEMILIKMLVF